MTKALLVIDLQNDYFPGGKYPLWNTDVVLKNVEGPSPGHTPGEFR